MSSATEAMNDKKISLLICDESGLLSDALATVMRLSDGIRLIADPVEDPSQAVEICQKHRPHVVLMGVHAASRSSATEATRRIKALSPSTMVMVMSGNISDDHLLEAIEAGADAIVPKAERVKRLFELIEVAASGEQLIDFQSLPKLIQRVSGKRRAKQEIVRRTARLTEREREILALLAKGMRNAAIANELVISERTVETHVQNILRKLEVHSKLEAVALKNGTIHLFEGASQTDGRIQIPT